MKRFILLLFMASVGFAARAKADGQIAWASVVYKRSAEIEMPEPVSKAGETWHGSFYGRTTKITLVVESAAWAADLTLTCRNLGTNGGHEEWLPAKNCGEVVLLTAGFHLAGEGAAFLLHKTGHHKLEQVPRWLLIGGSRSGAIYSFANR